MIWRMGNFLRQLKRRLFGAPVKMATKPTRVYLDYAAATPLNEAVSSAMKPYWNERFGNPSAIHQEGMVARQAVEKARQTVATLTAVRPEHVVFTGSGTESNNLAIRGYIDTLAASGRVLSDMHIVTTRLEHPATLATVQTLEDCGVVVSYVPVTNEGIVKPAALQAVLTSQTVLVSVAHINSEVGVIQSTQALARTMRAFATKNSTKRPLLHIDAAQSPWWQRCQLDRLGADMLSLDVGKCGGPKGGGVLVFAEERWVKKGIFFGGGQEFGLRPSTENVPLIVGTAAALQLAQEGVLERCKQIAVVRDRLWQKLQETVPFAVLNGPVGDSRVANNLHISLPGIDTEYAAVVLDAEGYAVSTKSACSSANSAASSVVMEMTNDIDRARTTLRITLGPETTFADVAGLPAALAMLVETMDTYVHSSAPKEG